MYNPLSLTAGEAETSDRSSLSSEEMALLRGENVALQSLLYGLCVSLSQMGEVHREVVIQALEYADRAPMAAALRNGSESGENGRRAYASTLANMRDLIIARIRF